VRSPVFDCFVCYSLGLLAQFKRKSVEPIARWIGVAVRMLPLFLSQFAWHHERIESGLRHTIMDEDGSENAIGASKPIFPRTPCFARNGRSRPIKSRSASPMKPAFAGLRATRNTRVL